MPVMQASRRRASLRGPWSGRGSGRRVRYTSVTTVTCEASHHSMGAMDMLSDMIHTVPTEVMSEAHSVTGKLRRSSRTCSASTASRSQRSASRHALRQLRAARARAWWYTL